MWRTTRYDLVLWAYPPRDPTTVLPGLIRLLDEVTGQQLKWHLAHQSDRPAPTSHAEWRALAEEQRDPQLGALDLFFDSPSGLELSLTVDAPSVVRDFDVLAVDFDPEHLAGPHALFSYESLEALFLKSIRLFRPFWARVADKELTRTDVGRIYLSVDVTKVPATVHWFNFFDRGMVERLGGREKLLGAPAYRVTELDEPAGLLLILQREPFDHHHPEHRQRLAAITDYLDLPQLQARYPKRR
jgi:hypothetical protein